MGSLLASPDNHNAGGGERFPGKKNTDEQGLTRTSTDSREERACGPCSSVLVRIRPCPSVFFFPSCGKLRLRSKETSPMSKTTALEPRFVDIVASRVGWRPHPAQA